jgi:hypothetical protein
MTAPDRPEVAVDIRGRRMTMVDDEPVRFTDAVNVYAPRSPRIRFIPGAQK